MNIKKLSLAVSFVLILTLAQIISGQAENVHASSNPPPETSVEDNQPAIQIVKIKPDKVISQYIGTSINFSVEAEGSNLQYKWTVYKDSKAVYTSTYSDSSSLIWTPKETGTYKANVSIKSGSIEIISDYTSEYIVQAKPIPIKITKVAPDKPVSQYLGSSINFSVSAIGSNLQYKWTVLKNSKIIYTSQYSSNNNLKWTPKEEGSYKAQVSIKNNVEEVLSNYTSEYKIIKPIPIKISKVSPEKPSTQYLGTSLNFGVQATGTSMQYKWIVYKDSLVVYTSQYSADSSLKWTPKEEGTYKAKVSIKNITGEVLSNFSNTYKVIVDVNSLVKPYIVTATITKDTTFYKNASYSPVIGKLKKGDKVELIRDSSGNWYNVKNTKNNIVGWVKSSYLSIPKDTAPSKDYMKKEHLERYVNENNFVSKSKYLIWVDLYRQQVNIFNGKKNSWKLVKTMSCSSGKNSSPTVRGSFDIKSRGPILYSGNVIAKNKVNFYGAYYFHSILYNTKGTKVVDGRLGQRLSHGCIRVSIENSKWIYDTIVNGTKVFIN